MCSVSDFRTCLMLRRFALSRRGLARLRRAHNKTGERRRREQALVMALRHTFKRKFLRCLHRQSARGRTWLMKKTAHATPKQRLKEERELRGWSQKYVAEQIGADHYYLSRWERGTASPSPYYRQKLCALFGRNARELGLLPEEDKESIRLPQEDQPGIFAPSETRVHNPAIPRLLTEQDMLVGCGEMLARLKNQLCKT